MGGNAVDNVERVDKVLYDNYCRVVSGLLPEIFGILTRFAIIPSYGAKKTFGDMDVLVCDSHLSDGWRERLNAIFSGINEHNAFVKNGPVTSFNFNGFQIDIILTDANTFDFSLGYFAYNDLGNLIGRIAHRAGFKFGHDGLWYPVRSGTYKHCDILVTNNFYMALEVLGFDVDRWDRGFVTLEDIFRFVADSEYFQRDMYPLEHRSNTARVRDAKRKTYTEFLKWIDEEHPDDGVSPTPIFTMASEKFPHFICELDMALEEMRVRNEVKAIFNGEIVKEITNLQGKELGMFIRYLHNMIPYSDYPMLLMMGGERVKGMIEADYHDYIKNT